MICHLQAGNPGKLVKASGIIQTKTKGLRTRGADDINPSPRAGVDEMRGPSSGNDAYLH